MSELYSGHRSLENEKVVRFLKGKKVVDLPLRCDLWNHSPTGFEWGYLGSGPAQLALAILAHATGCPALALNLHQRFKARVVLFFAKQKWSIRRSEVIAWVLQACEDDLCPPIEGYTCPEVSHARNR